MHFEAGPGAALERVGWALSLLALLAGCGRSGVGSERATACVPGRQVTCECAKGEGVQRCSDDGTHLTTCDCGGESPGAGGRGGAVGASGAGGNVGSAGRAEGSAGGMSSSRDCPNQLTSCGAVCVDLADSAGNCGRCGLACAADERCLEGKCQPACPPAEVACAGECVNLQTNALHCGDCAHACAETEVCADGACDCPPAYARCDGVCVDLSASDEHCGACDAACSGALHCARGACGKAGAGWQTLGYDMQRGGVSAEESGVPPLNRAWSKVVSVAPLNPVAVDRGRVVVSGNAHFLEDGPIFALDAVDGSQLWSFDFGEVSSLGHPTVWGGRVYVAHGKGSISLPDHAALHALDAASGRHLWESTLAAQWEHYWAPAVDDERVYINGGTYGGIYGISRKTGVEQFFGRLEQIDEWSPTLSGAGLLTMVEGKLRIHERATGAVQATIATPWVWHGSGMRTLVPERDGVAYVLARPLLRAYELQSRMLKWESHGDYTSFPAVTEDRVFALEGGSLGALDRATGALLWSFPADGELVYPPIVAADYVYVASDSHVFAVEAATGSLVWSADEGGWLSIGAAKLFIARKDGVLSAYDLTEGS